MTARPARQRKHDRLTWGGQTTREELAIDFAVAPFDRKAREMDRRWGVDRLPELVSPETAAKFGRTMASLNAAIDTNDAERAADRAAACVRGLDAMEREAQQLGHEPLEPPVEIVDVEGWRFGLLLDDRLWKRAAEANPGLRLYTVRELAVLALAGKANHPLMGAAKDAFAGAKIERVTIGNQPEDEVPF